jgi:CRISPR/Cas system endoribonuclease Cas6 (RAMP superfamily)
MWNMSYKYKNIYKVQPKFSHKKTVLTHKATQKYIHVHQYYQRTLFAQPLNV